MIIKALDIKKRLASFGYTVTDSDAFALNFIVEKITNTIKNDCNIGEIPTGLYQIVVDMVCGEFLLSKKAVGKLDINVEAAVSSIRVGDTSVGYAAPQKPITLDDFINWLMTYGRPQFATFRRLVW